MIAPGFELNQCLAGMWKRQVGCHDCCQELGRCHTCVTRVPLPSVNKAAHSGFETQRRCHQKSKTGVSVAPQKGLMSSKKKKRNLLSEDESFLNTSRIVSVHHR